MDSSLLGDEELNRRLSDFLKIQGVVILRVQEGSAAAAAGLEGATVTPSGGLVPGDVITAIEGRPIDSVGKLLARLDDFKVGDTVKVTVLRDGKAREVAVTLQPSS